MIHYALMVGSDSDSTADQSDQESSYVWEVNSAKTHNNMKSGRVCHNDTIVPYGHHSLLKCR